MYASILIASYRGKRNVEGFSQRYMFELTQKEFDLLMSQFVTSKKGRGGARYLPMVFTEGRTCKRIFVVHPHRYRQVNNSHPFFRTFHTN